MIFSAATYPNKHDVIHPSNTSWLLQALQHYQDEPHAGPVSARCGEFASREVVDEIISRGYSLPELLAYDNHNPRFPAFWDVYERETGGRRDSIGGQDIRTLQVRMVRCFRSYAFAAEAWRFVVAPELFHLPTALRIHSASEKLYRMMPSPVTYFDSHNNFVYTYYFYIMNE